MTVPRWPWAAGALAAAALGALAADAQPAATSGKAGPAAAPVWLPTALPWVAANKALGPLPQSVAIPPKAYAYAALSAAIEPFGKVQPTLLRVVLQVKSGSVGVFRSSADGSSQLSPELAMRTPGDKTVYFRILPGDPPAVIVIRNYGAEGTPGEVVIKSAEFARENQTPNADMNDAAKNGFF